MVKLKPKRPDVRVTLDSDFRDFYDYCFPIVGDKVFRRFAHDGRMGKVAQYGIMRHHLDLNTLDFELVKCQKFGSPLDNIVVYTDAALHCGEGKLLTSFNHALDFHPEKWSTPWVNTAGEYDRAESHRLLQIGGRAWWLKYCGQGGWMSNHCGETTISVVGECGALTRDDFPILENWPMFAIDFVVPVSKTIGIDFQDVLTHGFAIDFNTAPGIRGTGMNEILSAPDICELIRGWFES
jgi:hypothetical protein